MIISVVGGYELGSYGIRNTLEGTCYVYGTGIAEPRLSSVLNGHVGVDMFQYSPLNWRYYL